MIEKTRKTVTNRFSYLGILVLLGIHAYCNRPEESKPLLSATTLSDAQLFWETQAIDAGDANGKWHFISGWEASRREGDGTTSAVIRSGTNAFLRFSIHSVPPEAVAVRCRMEEGSGAELQVFINGNPAGSHAVHPEYREIQYPVSPKTVWPGENIVSFKVLSGRDEDSTADAVDRESHTAVSIDGIRFIRGKGSAGDPAGSGPSFDDSPVPAIRAPVPSKITVFKRIPSASRLYATYRLTERTGNLNAAARFRIQIESEHGERRELDSKMVRRRFFSPPEGTLDVSLQSFSGHLARISLEAVAVEGYPAPSEIRWVAEFRSEAIAKQPSGAIQARRPIIESKPNIILYLMDALRADYLQPYGYSKPVSPYLQAFSGESVVFENAYAQSAWTRASVASLFTGLYPSSHLVATRTDGLSGSLPTIATELNRLGYGTHGFITNGNVSRDFGFGKGFDLYEHLMERKNTREIHVQSDELIETVDAFLETGPASPFFLYVHASDPHEPYTPEPFSSEKRENCDFDDPVVYRASFVRHGRKPYNENTMECVRIAYESEILKADFYFGRFLNRLKEKKLYENSLILFTADHGEEFGEHGALGHGQNLHEVQIRVPLLARFPRAASERISTRVRHIDILPTILDYISARSTAPFDGESLLPLLQNQHASDRLIYSELDLQIHRSTALIRDGYKLLQVWRGPHHFYQLYYLVTDPQEQNDILLENPIRGGYMRAMLNEWRRAQEKKHMDRSRQSATPNPETQETLRALGYLD